MSPSKLKKLSKIFFQQLQLILTQFITMHAASDSPILGFRWFNQIFFTKAKFIIWNRHLLKIEVYFMKSKFILGNRSLSIKSKFFLWNQNLFYKIEVFFFKIEFFFMKLKLIFFQSKFTIKVYIIPQFSFSARRT